MTENAVVWKSIAAGTLAPALWLALRGTLPAWLTSVFIALAALTIFRLVPPRPVSTRRRDVAITAATIAAAAAAGLLVQTL